LTIKFERNAAKQINALANPLKARIKKGIDSLPNGDIKKVQGYTSTFRLRVGDYRVIIELAGNSIIIKAVLPRSSAYKNLQGVITMTVTRETLRHLVDIVDIKDIDIVCQILMRFIEEGKPLPDEVEAIKKSDESIAKYGLVDYSEIDWGEL